ncbi:MFS transporter [Nonomuraea sp. NPDC002799]
MKNRLPTGFRRLAAARVLSVTGDMMLPVAVSFAVLSTMGGGAAEVGVVLGAEFLGLLVFLLFGGVLADRLPPGTTLVAADLVRAAIQLVVALLLVTGEMTVPVLAGLLLVRGAASAFFSPAFGPLLLRTVGAERIQEASGRLGGVIATAVVAGPLMAGALVAWLGPAGAIAVDGLSFVVSALLILGLRRTSEKGIRAARGPSTVRELRDGAREVLSRPWLWGSIAVAAAVEFLASGPWSAVVPVVAELRYGGVVAYSWMMAALGVGAIVGSAVVARLPVRRHVMSANLLLVPMGLAGLALALHAELWVVLAAFTVCGVSQAMSGALWETALSLGVPTSSLGRVNSWDALGSFACRPAGQSAGGLLAARAGPDLVLWISTAVMVVAPLCLVASPRARQRTDDLRPAEETACELS